MTNKIFSFVIYLTATGVGIFSFAYPFFSPGFESQASLSNIRADQAPLMYTLLLGICVLVLLFETQSQSIDTKLIALLGILVAINSLLRFIEVAIPGPGGFSPIFFLIILVGYVFGARIGFLMGALTLFTSAIVTGGVGPWLLSQMFVAGWVGMSAPLVHWCVHLRKNSGSQFEVVILAVIGALWGFLYGAIMNLWSWPYMAGPVNQYWSVGTGVIDTLQRYGLFYLMTSLVWDASAALGNVVLISFAGQATLRTLRRFKQRFSFSCEPTLSHSA